MEIFCGPKKMMPLLFSLTLVMKTFQKVLGTSRLSFNCLQNRKFVVQKNDAIFILSGLSYENLPEGSGDSRV
jgi:hypothetical protein